MERGLACSFPTVAVSRGRTLAQTWVAGREPGMVALGPSWEAVGVVDHPPGGLACPFVVQVGQDP